MVKLSDEICREMVLKYQNGSKPVDLIKEYGISRATFFNRVKKYNEEEIQESETDNQSESSYEENDNATIESNEEEEIHDDSDDNITYDPQNSYDDDEFINNVRNFDNDKQEIEIETEPIYEKPNQKRFIPTEQPKFEIKPPKNENKEKQNPNDSDEIRVLIRTIKNYCKEFEPHLHHLMGKTEPQQRVFLNSLATKTKTELLVIRDDIAYSISSKNSNNMLKILYLSSMGTFENIGTKYLNLKLQGLQQTLANNRDLDLIMKELACMYNLNLFNDPRARLIMLTGMTVLTIDGKNRAIEQQIEINKIREKNNNDANVDANTNKTPILPQKSQSDIENFLSTLEL